MKMYMSGIVRPTARRMPSLTHNPTAPLQCHTVLRFMYTAQTTKDAQTAHWLSTFYPSLYALYCRHSNVTQHRNRSRDMANLLADSMNECPDILLDTTHCGKQ